MTFFVTFLCSFGSKINILWKFNHHFWLYSVQYSQFLRMFSRFGWLHGKVNCKIFEKSTKSNRLLKMEQNEFFFKILNEIAFWTLITWERYKKRLEIIFPAILERLLSRQAKMRFKRSKLSPGFEKLLEYC